EQTGGGQRGEDQNILRQRRRRAERKRIEHIGQDRTKQRCEDDLPPAPYRAHQQYGEQVEESERKGSVYPPVDYRDGNGQESRERHTRGSRQAAQIHAQRSPTI